MSDKDKVPGGLGDSINKDHKDQVKQVSSRRKIITPDRSWRKWMKKTISQNTSYLWMHCKVEN